MRYSSLYSIASLGGALAITIGSPVHAQEATSRAVVQPLPSSQVQDLNRALRKLARSPRNLDALIEAGNASLKVDDLDAAMGFFGRAADLSSENPRVKVGMASVFLRSGRPIDALRLFSEAEEAGASQREIVTDRGLAYDLVGDSTRAQANYRRALSIDPDNPEAIRRLALSQAISGESNAFEATLRPLIDKREFAAFRTRAFGLAILGEQDRAAAITDAVMPRDLAGRITPYLAYMPRLTKAQQAAAANLGIFPRAAEIGRDDPRIAQYAANNVTGGSSVAVQTADNRLEPAGEPLGAATEVAVAPETRSAVTEESPKPGFDLARAENSASTTPAEPVAETRTVAPNPQPTPPPNFADAFSDIGGGELPAIKTTETAVNLAAIEIPREAEPEAAKLAEPAHPRRIWVQVATGRDVSALKFDWRRIARKAPDLLGDLEPHVVPWGQSNRLLAGPVSGSSEARELVNSLKQKGLDTFSYTSPEGTEIQKLK
ncbi:MAG: SPOR domain-containing protein [Pseudomonadota bacterium]